MLDDSKKKYTKEQKRKAKYMQDQDAEKGGVQQKTDRIARLNNPSDGAVVADPESTSKQSAEHKKRFEKTNGR